MSAIEHKGEQVCFDEAVFIDKVKHLTLHDGDMLVFEYPGVFTKVAYDRLCNDIHKVVKERMGLDIGSVVLEEGLTLSAILTKAKEKEAQEVVHHTYPRGVLG